MGQLSLLVAHWLSVTGEHSWTHGGEEIFHLLFLGHDLMIAKVSKMEKIQHLLAVFYFLNIEVWISMKALNANYTKLIRSLI